MPLFPVLFHTYAQDFWFTADEKCVPGGPAFDYTYYNTYTAVVGSFTVHLELCNGIFCICDGIFCTRSKRSIGWSQGWVGILIFQTFMSGWTFRNLFWVTTIMQVQTLNPKP